MQNAQVSKKTNYFSWLLHQLQGWGSANYWLFGVALGLQSMSLVNSPISLIAIITFLSAMIGVACILSINAVRPINGILGIVSALGFIYVGFVAKNYLTIAEQLAYVITLDLPVLIGGRYKWSDNTVNEIKTFGPRQWIVSIIFTIAMFLISSFGIQALTAEPRPFIDGLSFAICLTAGIICFLRYNNQYWWWLASGLIQVILWGVTFHQGGASIAMLLSSSVYLLNDVIAFSVSPWFKHNRKNSK